MMKLSSYQQIVECMRSVGYTGGSCLVRVSKLFPQFSQKTLGSIFSQEYQRKTKKTYHKHHLPERIESYYGRYLAETKAGARNVLLRMSAEIDMAPSLLARLIIERHLTYTECDGEPPPKQLVSQCLKDTALIKDPVLAEEVNVCTLSDQVYGPVVDVIKHSVGQEYECLLKFMLKKKNLAFLGEDDLRTKGYDKTPDVKLEIPIAVDGHVVNWIESKASFGDEESHRGYLKEQFWSYWNRFGPGLVIYWFGFIDELDTHREKGILLMDHFPDTVTTMNPLGLLPHGLGIHGAAAAQCGAQMVLNGAAATDGSTE